MDFAKNKIDFLYIFNYESSVAKEALMRFRCSLKSIVGQNVNICVSNNSSACILNQISDIVPNVRYIHSPHKGTFSRALGINYAVRRLVKSEYFIISDIDLVYSRDHMQRLNAKFQLLKRQGEKIRLVTYNYNLLPVTEIPLIRKRVLRIPMMRFFLRVNGKELPHVYTHEYEVLDQLPRSRGGYAHGNGLIHQESFFDIRGFDEEMVGYGPEDDLFNTRISKVNRIIYDNLNDTATFHLWHPRFHMIQFEKNMQIWNERKLHYNSLVNPTINDIIANRNKADWGVI